MSIANINKYKIQWGESLIDPKFWEQTEGDEPRWPQKRLNVSDEVLSDYYTAATQILNDQNWQDAQDAFLFLTFLNPSYVNFWLGLGISFQSQQEYEAALMAYLNAEAISGGNPSLYINAFQCHMALGNENEANEYYEKTVEACKDKPEYDYIIQGLLTYKH